MTIRETLSRLRRYIGWADISEARLSPDHGWLLPTPSTLDSLRAERREPGWRTEQKCADPGPGSR
jgi:hypothetical protein